jgi:superkiller protein 3
MDWQTENVIRIRNKIFQLNAEEYKSKFDLLLTRGYMYFEIEKYEEAITDFNSALLYIEAEAKTENDAASLFDAIHEANSRLGRYNDALTAIESAIQNCPGHCLYYRSKATLLHKLQRLEESIEFYNKSMTYTSRTCYLLRGSAYHDLGKYDLAILDFDYSCTHYKESTEAYKRKARSLFMQKRYFEALRAMDRGKQIESLDDEQETEDVLREFEQEVLVYDRVLEMDPRNIDALISKGVGMNILGRYEDAIVLFDRSIECGSNADAYCHKGYACYNLRRYEQALELYNKAIDLNSHYRLALEIRQVVESALLLEMDSNLNVD